MDVVGAEERLVDAARLALAVALVGSVRGDGDVAPLGETLRVPARGLFLGAPVVVRNGDRRVAAVRVVAGRGVNVAAIVNPRSW